MRGFVIVHLALLGATAALLAAPAHAITVDGRLDAGYGVALSTQTCQAIRSNNLGQILIADGTDLDEAYGVVEGGTLYLMLTGNLATSYCPTGPINCGESIVVFFDTGAGGQNPLLANHPASSPDDLWQLAGLAFDTAFTPGWFLEVRGIGPANPGTIWVEYASLPSGALTTPTFLGQGLADGTTTLAGGTNPFGIQVAVDETNVAGVTSGCGAASGAGASTGLELAIPLAALGSPAGCIRICAFGYDPRYDDVLNQVLGPVPPGRCDLGAPSGVNFAAIPGDQFFSVCVAPTPARGSTWGGLKSVYR